MDEGKKEETTQTQMSLQFRPCESPYINRDGTNRSEKKYLLVLSDNIKTTGKFPNDTHKGVNFLICQSCYWCASCLSSDSTYTKCPSCIEGNRIFSYSGK
jgi:hypothetical protein